MKRQYIAPEWEISEMVSGQLMEGLGSSMEIGEGENDDVLIRQERSLPHGITWKSVMDREEW